MKTLTAFPLFLLAILAGPVLAETSAPSITDCVLVGPVVDVSADCNAKRAAFRAEVAACMDQMQAEAEARPGAATTNGAHTTRARFLMCDAANRAKLGLASQ